MQSILIVDDLESIHEMLDAVIQPIGYNTAFATDGEIALQKLREERYDIVLTDINMKPMDGIALLSEIKKIDPNAIVMMMSGYANIDNATQALKLGAFDFLTKPFKVDQLMASITRASKERKKRLESGASDTTPAANMLAGDSPTVKRLNEHISRCAKLSTPLLVSGESGTQKISLANTLHARGDSDGKLVTINAKTTSEDDLYAALFDQDGNPSETLKSAQDGTLLIANIEHLPLNLQQKLGNLFKELKTDTRIICTAPNDLEKLIDAGKFDDALYFRISTNILSIPSLRDRSEDIPAMALAYFATQGYGQATLGEQASALLQAYRWPGNYTEFEEVLSAALESAGGNIVHEADLPEKLQDTSNWPNLETFLEEQAARYRAQVLKACAGDKLTAARVLGIDASEL